MSTISKSLLGFLFNGATVALAAAPWKNNVRALYGFNAAGNGYRVFKPGNRFNSLTELVQDGSYILDAVTPGFELPGATLVVAPGGPPAPATTWPTAGTGVLPSGLFLNNVSARANGGQPLVSFSLEALDVTDRQLLVVITGGYTQLAQVVDVAANTYFQFNLDASNTVGSVVFVTAISRNGHVYTQRATVSLN